MKQVIRGNPEKWTFIFWQMLYLFGVHKKWWIRTGENGNGREKG
jgi:hypothetical protein